MEGKKEKFLISSNYDDSRLEHAIDSESSPFDSRFNVDAENGVGSEIWI